MARYEEHFARACSDLEFLRHVNEFAPERYDWQITVAYYVAVHLINAHLAKCGLHFQSHNPIRSAINAERSASPTAISPAANDDYELLTMLSRRARYLISEREPHRAPEVAHYVFDKHLPRALRFLDTVIDFFFSKYGEKMPRVTLHCAAKKHTDTYTNFEVTADPIRR